MGECLRLRIVPGKEVAKSLERAPALAKRENVKVVLEIVDHRLVAPCTKHKMQQFSLVF